MPVLRVMLFWMVRIYYPPSHSSLRDAYSGLDVNKELVRSELRLVQTLVQLVDNSSLEIQH